MFRFKGNVVHQLNKIYGTSFKQKYKEDLLNRIIFFVSEKIKINDFNCLFSFMEFYSKFISFDENNKPLILKQLFFDEYKQELFNSFNPLWYDSEQPILKYGKKEIDFMFFSLFNKLCYEVQIKYIDSWESIGYIYKNKEVSFREYLFIKSDLKFNSCSINPDISFELIFKHKKESILKIVDELKVLLDRKEEFDKKRNISYEDCIVYDSKSNKFDFDFGLNSTSKSAYYIEEPDFIHQRQFFDNLLYHFRKNLFNLLNRKIEELSR